MEEAPEAVGGRSGRVCAVLAGQPRFHGHFLPHLKAKTSSAWRPALSVGSDTNDEQVGSVAKNSNRCRASHETTFGCSAPLMADFRFS